MIGNSYVYDRTLYISLIAWHDKVTKVASTVTFGNCFDADLKLRCFSVEYNSGR